VVANFQSVHSWQQQAQQLYLYTAMHSAAPRVQHCQQHCALEHCLLHLLGSIVDSIQQIQTALTTACTVVVPAGHEDEPAGGQRKGNGDTMQRQQQWKHQQCCICVSNIHAAGGMLRPSK
jgi:hypothetical protein